MTAIGYLVLKCAKHTKAQRIPRRTNHDVSSTWFRKMLKMIPVANLLVAYIITNIRDSRAFISEKEKKRRF